MIEGAIKGCNQCYKRATVVAEAAEAAEATIKEEMAVVGGNGEEGQLEAAALGRKGRRQQCGRHMGAEEEGRNISVAEESTTRSDGRQRRGGKVLRLRATVVVIATAIGKGNDAAGQRRKKVASGDAATCVGENVAGRRLWQGVGGCARVEQRPRRVWLGGCDCNCG
ncbi:hypothetical protein B296_00036182 [Ensete ventricosum]|uniref:Uncharacterized protein n=1 Tax=Ensete ventricosum TaxID=4639 RepID=A0A426YIA5_ENSVE|nr:hypothetical protein B296_00036182 [Ensete ventricosum]